uniref:Uncharacterized protein n=1 Tax=Mycena chlorophos TaxID=658473 RepID=A0ABQ0M127_MYCCL|nr:predicted protein [Mycena chlorophos]
MRLATTGFSIPPDVEHVKALKASSSNVLSGCHGCPRRVAEDSPSTFPNHSATSRRSNYRDQASVPELLDGSPKIAVCVAAR